MTGMRWFLAFVLLGCGLPVFAQNSDEDAVREKQRRRLVLAESIIAESRDLRLPENRALVFAKMGSSVWDLDRKRAEDLFHDAVIELLAAQAEAEQDRLRGRQNEMLTGQNTRPQVLNTIASRDADLALRSLFRTRPASIERAMAGVNAKETKIRNSPGGDAYLVQNELHLEQTITRLAADRNPDKAVALLRAALKKGITSEAISLLQKVHDKDPAAAAEIGSELASQLLKKSFLIADNVDYTALQASFSFLNDHIRQRPAADKTFKFAAADMRSLADKLIAFFLDRGNQPASTSYAHQMLPIAEKMRPDSVEKLKELGKNLYSNRGFHGYSQDPELSRLLNNETPIEEMLSAAPKLPVEHRRQVYQNAANRLASAGEITRARQIIGDNFSEDALTSAQEGLNWQYVNQLINHGKYADAELLINDFPEASRFSALISLAGSVYHSNQEENKIRALGILAKAAAGVPARPETNMEMQQSLQLAMAYAGMEPTEAFRILDGLVPQINELAEASAVVNGFQGSYNFRRGEMVVAGGNNFGIYVDTSMLRILAQKDFDRTVSLVGTFSRREMRIALKQQLLESL